MSRSNQRATRWLYPGRRPCHGRVMVDEAVPLAWGAPGRCALPSNGAGRWPLSTLRLVWACLILLPSVSSCDDQHNVLPPDWGLNRMIEQPKYVPYGAGAFFADGMAMRLPPEGTMPRRQVEATVPVDLALLQEGRRRFDVVCGACHGILGNGESAVAENMPLVKPPSFHSERLRNAPDEHLQQVIRGGWGMMPGYGYQLNGRQIQAVVAYLRALQLSQHAALEGLSPSLKQQAIRELGE